MSSAVLTPTPRPISIQLLTGPEYPLETLYYVWQQSRHNNPIPSPKDIGDVLHVTDVQCDVWRKILSGLGYEPSITGAHCFREHFNSTVQMLCSEEIPCVENLTFVFAIENIPVSLREQMVRHRIGTKFDARVGADLVSVDHIPDLAQSSWWSQTMRVIDMGKFYDDGQFFIPESVGDQPCHSMYGSEHTAQSIYLNLLQHCQNAYNALVAAGVHKEDARQVLPMCVTHRLTWEINLKAILHVIGKRTCWISQRGMWQDIVEGMVRELIHIHPSFRAIANPPCIKGDEWKSCPYEMINQERITGEDGFPPCPLYLNYGAAKMVQQHASNPTWFIPEGSLSDRLLGPKGPAMVERVTFPGGWVSRSESQAERMKEDRTAFGQLWKRDVDTGEPLP